MSGAVTLPVGAAARDEQGDLFKVFARIGHSHYLAVHYVGLHHSIGHQKFTILGRQPQCTACSLIFFWSE